MNAELATTPFDAAKSSSEADREDSKIKWLSDVMRRVGYSVDKMHGTESASPMDAAIAAARFGAKVSLMAAYQTQYTGRVRMWVLCTVKGHDVTKPVRLSDLENSEDHIDFVEAVIRQLEAILTSYDAKYEDIECLMLSAHKAEYISQMDIGFGMPTPEAVGWEYDSQHKMYSLDIKSPKH